MDFVMHVEMDEELIPDYDIDYAARLIMDMISGSEFRGKIVIRPLSEIIAC